MRYILPVLLCCCLTASAQNNYEKEWARIDKYAEGEKARSYIPLVTAIYRQAKRDGNTARAVKAGMLLSQYTAVTQDPVAGLRVLDSLIREEKGVVKAVLLSVKARKLYNYADLPPVAQTPIQGDNDDDITSWDAKRFRHASLLAYRAALADTALLQSTRVGLLDSVLETRKDTRHFRPTVFDLLAHSFLEQFQPGYLQEDPVRDSSLFAPAARFTTTTYLPEDTTWRTDLIRTYQQLLRFHQREKNIDALLYNDVERVQFANKISSVPDQFDVFIRALEGMLETYASAKELGHVYYWLGNHYSIILTPFNRIDTAKQKTAALRAKAYVEKGMNIAPGSSGSKYCRNLYEYLMRKELQLESAKVNIPGEPFLMHISYRNVTEMHIRLILLTENISRQVEMPRTGRNADSLKWAYITSLRPLKTWKQSLPGSEDLLQHTLDMKMEALPIGRYMVLASPTERFTADVETLSALDLNVSNISYVVLDHEHIYALHRNTGQPLPGAVLQVREKTGKVLGEYHADKNGRVSVPKEMVSNTSYRMAWFNVKDSLLPDGAASNWRMDWYQKEWFKKMWTEMQRTPRYTWFYTDRAIYRPGQTVYFKTLVTRLRGDAWGKQDIIPQLTTKVYLTDHYRRKKYDSLTIRTNEFGSAAGQFTLPAGISGNFVLTGENDYGSRTFAVEEYKRPRFLVSFDTLRTAHRLKDTITVQGKAMAYAGNQLGHAKVTYTVNRMPFGYLYRFRNYFVMPYLVKEGSTETDAAGKFGIRFPALPDEQPGSTPPPYQLFEVTAHVTDVNGETRSGTYIIKAGNYEVEVIADEFAQPVAKDRLSAFHINTLTMNGAFKRMPVTVSVTPLKHPGRLMRPRYWGKPDQFLVTKEDFLRDFPLDVYNDEDDINTWERGVPRTLSGTTAKDSAWNIAALAAEPGWYEIVVRAGEAETSSRVLIIDPQSGQLPFPEYEQHFTSWQNEREWKVEQFVPDKVFQLQAVGSNIMEAPQVSAFSLKQGINRMEMPVSKEMTVSRTFVKDNRVFTWEEKIAPKLAGNALKVEVATHRNKLLPGEQEHWKVKVTGVNGTPVAAELAVRMYDASLDAFRKDDWKEISPDIPVPGMSGWDGVDNFRRVMSYKRWNIFTSNIFSPLVFDRLESVQREMFLYAKRTMSEESSIQIRGNTSAEADMAMAPPPSAEQVQQAPEITEQPVGIMPRRDFRETAFFIPQLGTDASGEVSFDFTMPEALTSWNFQAIAHTKDLVFGEASAQIITQKPMMVAPNTPRFLREGDKLEIGARISNVTDSMLIGQARLDLLDADTRQPVDGWFTNIFPVQHFTVNAKQSTAVAFQVKVPSGYNKPVVYRITAESGHYSDGEEAALPVLPNRMLVTESMPIHMRGNGTKNFTFEKLLQSNGSQTLQHQSLVFQYNANPAWYAVQSLPYLMEFPHECAEQVFSRYYANLVAAHVVKATPRIREIFSRGDTTVWDQNEELKSALLEETPWVMDAANEREQRKRLSILFDMHRMAREADKAASELRAMQQSSGAFPWFSGMGENPYVTRHILAGMAHLKELKIAVNGMDTLIQRALKFIEKDDNLPALYVKSLYGRAVSRKALNGVKAGWRSYGLQQQAMAALMFFHQKDVTTARQIIQHLKENALQSDELGMYWRKNRVGYGWYESPIETQSLIITAFNTITKDEASVDAMKTWLLRNRQTHSWSTTKATADASYALLLTGSKWLDATPEVRIEAGGQAITVKAPLGSETGKSAQGNTRQAIIEEDIKPVQGNIHQTITGEAVKSAMGNIRLTVTGNGNQPSWGAVHWQYFEQLDKISSSTGALQIRRELFKQSGNTLVRIDAQHPLRVGDKVIMRIVLKADRDMEFVHLKDMRPACLEPVNVLSGYKWGNGMGYYESTKDVATHFFFDRLAQGTHVLEYPLFVSHAGRFAGGISTLQCMYAPEFSAHSGGMDVEVAE